MVRVSGWERVGNKNYLMNNLTNAFSSAFEYNHTENKKYKCICADFIKLCFMVLKIMSLIFMLKECK